MMKKQNKLLDAAARLFLQREREQLDRFFNAVGELKETGKFTHFENTNSMKIWTWGCKRWKKDFPEREYELRELQEQESEH